jgi:hypothetical protein
VIGFVILTLVYLAAIVAAWFGALVGGMFLARAGFRQPFGANPGYVMLSLALLLALLAAIVNPSVYLLGFGSAAAAIFTGFVTTVIGLSLVAAVGYLLTPHRVSRYYERTQGWLDGRRATFEPRGAALREQEVSRDKPGSTPVAGEQKLDG